MSSPDSDSPKIVLHWLEKSRAQRILWLLEELNVAYEIKRYKRDPKTALADPQLKAIHPLGKAPVITIGDMVLAESAFITEYLSDHFGGGALVPKRWKDGQEGKLGGETESYLRYRYFMHYTEGSLMSLLLVALVQNNIKTAPVPFFIKPVTSGIAGKIAKGYTDPNFVAHFQFLEDQLATAPEGGPYLCGPTLTGADLMMSYPTLLATSGSARAPGGLTKESHPRLFAYGEKLQESESYKRAVEKIIALEGEYSLSP
ncbi:Glutathione S-transferase [Mycena indigotica]|uniref:glutathione transferase n=1 Tax=Mycena indigotica TaxID=2126181 RepID=A0A8H6RXW6_9AGAR|nr:Glutathione S-transferase [Mycena indigotica]KAF7289339.1 Glutathione S-transferase [Mycena indigotica]